MRMLVNAGVNHWYPKGSERLRKSICETSPSVDTVIYGDFPNQLVDKSNPYNIKASALYDVRVNYFTRNNHPVFLWADCSVWAIKDISPIFDIIERDGYYLLSSGYNAAQTCSDKCLDYFGFTRDEAEKIPDSSTMVFGLDLNTKIGEDFFIKFIRASYDGVFNGSREHDNQSQDPRFLFHRQDQSAATCIAHKLGMKLHSFGQHVAYDQDEVTPPESVVMLARGM